MGAEGRDLYGRDSIASCDAYSNPYDLRPDAELARRKQFEKAIALGSDAMETKQSKLERELIEKFQKNQFTLLGNPRMAGFVAGGKFFLIAFVMPAYLFFYGLPRWLLKNTLPPAAAVLTQAVQQVQSAVRFSLDWLKNVYKATIHKAENLFAWNRGSEQSKNAPKGLLASAYHFMAAKAIDLSKTLQQAVLNAYQKAGSLMTGVYQFFAAPVAKLLDAQLQMVKKIADGFADVYAKISEAIRGKALEAKEAIREHYENAANAVKNVFNPVLRYVSQRYEDARQALANQYNHFVEKASQWKEGIVRVYHAVVDRPIERAKERLKEMWEGAQSIGQTVAAPAVAATVWAQEQFINLAAVGRQAALYTSEQAKKSLVWFVAKALPALAAKLLPRWMNPLTWYKRGRSFQQAMARFAGKLQAYAVMKAQELVKKGSVWLARLAAVFMRVAAWAFRLVKKGALALHRKYTKPLLPYLTLEAMINGAKVAWLTLRLIGRYAQQLSRAFINDMTS